MALKTRFMELFKPAIGPGAPTQAQAAELMNRNLDNVAGHDHSKGKGVPITPDGLNINKSLDMNRQSLINTFSFNLVNIQNSEDIEKIPNNSFFIFNGTLAYKTDSGRFSVASTDNLDALVEAIRDLELGGVPEVNVLYGITNRRSAISADPDVAKAEASNAFAIEANRNEKAGVNLVGGVRLNYATPIDAGFYYLWAALRVVDIDSLEFFNKDFISDNYWLVVADQNLNGTPYRLYVRRIPVGENKQIKVFIKDFA